ncbi:MAG: hypothetical protein HZA54_06700 [Planctomycetes bacterium]|nr:hypothetical protein [Planctomycetota bacterium]
MAEAKCAKCGASYTIKLGPDGKPGSCPFCPTVMGGAALRAEVQAAIRAGGVKRPPSGPVVLSAIIHFDCGKCGAKLRVPRTEVGENHKCHKCGHSQVVPKAPPAPPAPPGALAPPAGGAGAVGAVGAVAAAAAQPAGTPGGASAAGGGGGADAAVKTTKRPTAFFSRSITVVAKCPKCGVETRTTHGHIGETIACKGCGGPVLVPARAAGGSPGADAGAPGAPPAAAPPPAPPPAT